MKKAKAVCDKLEKEVKSRKAKKAEAVRKAAAEYKTHFQDDLEKEELGKIELPEKMGDAASIADQYFKISDRLFEK